MDEAEEAQEEAMVEASLCSIEAVEWHTAHMEARAWQVLMEVEACAAIHKATKEECPSEVVEEAEEVEEVEHLILTTCLLKWKKPRRSVMKQRRSSILTWVQRYVRRRRHSFS